MVDYYKLANKYIIIAPKKVAGLKEKLKGILPVGIIAIGISAVIEFVSRLSYSTSANIPEGLNRAMEAGVAEMVVDEAESVVAKEIALDTVAPVTTNEPNIALWFLIGSLATITIYVLFVIIKHYWQKKK